MEQGGQKGFPIRSLAGISTGGGCWGVVHTLPLAMPCALLRVLATSAYLSLAIQGPESLRPSSLLFSCPHWSLAFLSPKTGYEVKYSHPLLPPIPATLGGVEAQRVTSLPLLSLYLLICKKKKMTHPL